MVDVRIVNETIDANGIPHLIAEVDGWESLAHARKSLRDNTLYYLSILSNRRVKELNDPENAFYAVHDDENHVTAYRRSTLPNGVDTPIARWSIKEI